MPRNTESQIATEASGALVAAAGSVLAPLRLGVIGCELGRTRYGTALASLPSLQVAALADTEERFARVWARELGSRTPVYEDATDLLAQPLDAVLVATPLSERAERIAEALRAGQPVLAEAPFAASLTSDDDLLALAAQQAALLMPALPRRFDPFFEAVTQQLRAGSVGALQQVRCAWSFPLENVEPTGDYVTGGWNAILQTLACQTIDLCRWWQGEGKTVSADIDLEGIGPKPRARHRMPPESTLANILIAHAQGQSTHQIARTRSIRPDERYLLTGAEGSMELTVSAGASATPAPALKCQRAGHRAQLIQPDLSPEETTLSPAALRIRRLLQHFAQCVRSGNAPEITGADERAALGILHAAYISTQENIKVTLPLRRAPDIAAILLGSSAAPRSLPPGR